MALFSNSAHVTHSSTMARGLRGSLGLVFISLTESLLFRRLFLSQGDLLNQEE